MTNESGLLTILDLSTFKKEIRQLSNTELTVYTVDKENNLYLIDKNNYLICFNLDTNEPLANSTKQPSQYLLSSIF